MRIDADSIFRKVRELAGGQWRRRYHVTMVGKSLYYDRSELDSRIDRLTVIPAAEGRRIEERFVFEDDNVDVECREGGAILLGAHEFGSLDDLAEALLKHDEEVRRAREWEAAERCADRARTAP